MNYRNKISYLLVRKLGLSFKEANKALTDGRVRLNQNLVYENVLVSTYDSLSLDDTLVQSEKDYVYFAYHKPKGVECSLSEKIPESLFHLAPEPLKGLFYAGRLDKDSEGLLILMNDGHLYNRIIQPKYKVAKQYEVFLEKAHDEVFLNQMSSGVNIKGGLTLPCEVWPLGSHAFGIRLNQGLNRQIRRMCFALGNYVTQLRRVSIGNINLGDLAIGDYRQLNEVEITQLRNL